ncbi:MAG: winged helix-turn-helix transcriptional regulator [Anaerolineae bacterium]|nr:winged helix-turn-helix transcriptional regulator [Anaerolineae bacterium]
MADWDFILAPSTVTVEFTIDEPLILLHSMRLVSIADVHSGLNDWVIQTAHKLEPDVLRHNHFVLDVADHVAMHTEPKTFPELIAAVQAESPQTLVEYALHWLRDYDAYPGDDVLLSNAKTMVNTVHELLAEKLESRGEEFDDEAWHDRYQYLVNPEQLQELCVQHLQMMWDHYLKAEWQRIQPMLKDAYEAFSSMDYSGLTAHEAIETITERNMRGADTLSEKLKKVNKLIFMPSAHLGPYIAWMMRDEGSSMIIFFGVRQPKNAKVQSLALSRSELLVRLNALADETRLRILELLTEHQEMCAQDFITRLDLSQSSASRHLRQLTASGYISERRRDVAKCYSLNPERVEDTIQALRTFLHPVQ